MTDYSQNYSGALAFHRMGRTEEAIELASRCLAETGPQKLHAVILIGEALLRSGRVDELAEHLERFRDLASEPRITLIQARLLVQQQADSSAKEVLLQLKEQSADKKVARAAAFELVRLLDRQGHYSEAWETATSEHHRSTHSYPVELMERALLVTATAAKQVGKLRVRRASRDVRLTAFLTGVPRSGTSLLEQMLDSHSKISGLGENPIVGSMADAIAAEGRGWPSGAQTVPTRTLDSWQKQYVNFVRQQSAVPEDMWSIDKTVFPMFQPLAIGCVLPGSHVIRIIRDPRDAAVSLYLSNFDPTWGWTGSLKAIERVIAAESTCAPVILQSLNIPHVELNYELLVDQPRETVTKALNLLGLSFEDACLNPEANSRVVMTLSNQQVRESINRNSIGRWLHYQDQLQQANFNLN